MIENFEEDKKKRARREEWRREEEGGQGGPTTCSQCAGYENHMKISCLLSAFRAFSTLPHWHATLDICGSRGRGRKTK